MYNSQNKNRALPVSISVVILVAVSTMQLSPVLTSNGNIAANNPHAKYTNGERQSQTPVDGTDLPMNMQISDPGNEIAQAPSSPPGPPGLEKELQVRQVVSPVTVIDPNALEVIPQTAILTSL
jgi:hypothetical protein